LTLFESETYTRSMKSRRFLPAVVSLLAVAAAGSGHLNAQAIQRALYVSVVDDKGVPVKDLTTSDVIVREDNVAREVLRVAPATEPMQIALLIDTSSASRDNISFFRSALPTFVTALTNPNDAGRKNEVAIIAFGERPTIITDYTTNVGELQKGINRLWSLPDTGAYLLDALLEVTKGFKVREAKRPVIVAITQEGTELSYRHYDQVVGPLRDSGAALYALMLGTPTGDISEEARSRNLAVEEGTRTTGGYREQLLTPMGLASGLRTLADRLTHQFVVTYGRPQSLIPPERVTVSAAKPGMVARGTLIKEAQGRP
jgi:hypothetical protein